MNDEALNAKREMLERSIYYWGTKTIDLQAEADLLLARLAHTKEARDKAQAEWEATFVGGGE